MSKDTMFGGSNSNLPAAASISETFNRQNELAEQVAQLPQNAQEKVRLIRELAEQRRESEMQKQRNRHEFRELKMLAAALEKYILDPNVRPSNADKKADVEIIKEDVKRNLSQQEAYYLRRIERDAEANIRQIVVSERQGRDFRRNEPEHDREPEY